MNPRGFIQCYSRSNPSLAVDFSALLEELFFNGGSSLSFPFVRGFSLQLPPKILLCRSTHLCYSLVLNPTERSYCWPAWRPLLGCYFLTWSCWLAQLVAIQICYQQQRPQLLTIFDLPKIAICCPLRSEYSILENLGSSGNDRPPEFYLLILSCWRIQYGRIDRLCRSNFSPGPLILFALPPGRCLWFSGCFR